MFWYGQPSPSREAEIADAEPAEDLDPDADAQNFTQDGLSVTGLSLGI
jgi:hypothetical protein